MVMVMVSYYCCIPGCVSDSRKDPERKLSFHSIPVAENLRKEWVTRIGRDVGPNFKITSWTKVCSMHFKPEDFSKSLTGLRMLKKGTVPSLLLWDGDPRTARIKRIKQSTSPSETVLNVPTKATCQSPSTKLLLGSEQEDQKAEQKKAEIAAYLLEFSSQPR